MECDHENGWVTDCPPPREGGRWDFCPDCGEPLTKMAKIGSKMAKIGSKSRQADLIALAERLREISKSIEEVVK